MVNKLITQGILELEEHCWFFLNGSETSDFLGKLFLEHFSPEHLQSLHEREMIGIQKMLSLSGLPFDSPERRKIVEEFERLMEGYSDYFRVTFEPLANQGEILILEGDLSVEGFEFSLEGPSSSGFLSTIFLQHFLPENSSCEGEDEDETPIELGPYKIVFEQISQES